MGDMMLLGYIYDDYLGALEALLADWAEHRLRVFPLKVGAVDVGRRLEGIFDAA